MSSHYIDVLKASYDYAPQSEDEIEIKEDQILLLLEKTDQDWWRVKVKSTSEEESEGGLVPAAYVEPAGHTFTAKALYNYDANAPGELSVKEEETLLVYDKDDDWLLVKSEKDEGRVGFVPGNYVEETTGQTEVQEEEEAVVPSRIIIPPSPPRPVSTYVDPAELVAANKTKTDSIQTWAVSEVDKKGKKKKGTLGIGNGSLFFASESDKTPVQKWQTSEVESSRIEKAKHVYVEIGGASHISLHFNAGSKDTADAIISKLESSSLFNMPKPVFGATYTADEESEDVQEAKPKRNGVSVHFAPALTSIIPEAASQEEEADDEQATPFEAIGEPASVLYDFTADGEEELSVKEGEELFVLERDGDEWWKCRNASGAEGVVPASYIELHDSEPSNGPTAPNAEEEERAIHEAEEVERQEAERREIDRREKERKRQEADRREKERKQAEREQQQAEVERQAKVAAATAEVERRRREREAEERAQAERRAERRRARGEDAEQKSSAARDRPSSGTGSIQIKQAVERSSTTSPSKENTGKARASTDNKARGPAPKNTRLWHDKTGKFEVEAELLSYNNGILRLHKINGVVIEVPIEKMSPEDMQFVQKFDATQGTSASDDDEPLALRRKSLPAAGASTSAPEAPKPPTNRLASVKKAPSVDWFEFFLNAGCDVDDCTRYATSFERDKIDETILPDITDQTMRSLGLREGDIIRVKKAITQRTGKSLQQDDATLKEQLRKDEEFARQLEAEENGVPPAPKRQTTSPAPNLFAGPGGALKNNTQRRGRPQPSKSTPPINVDLEAIASASEQITQRGSPAMVQTTSPTSLISVQPPARSSSVIPAATGFDDDAWTPRPSSTKPPIVTPSSAKTPSVPLRAPSVPAAPPAPPAPAPPVPQVQTTLTATLHSPIAGTSTTSGGLARATENDVFEQLARLSQLKTRTPAISAPTIVQSASSPPPRGFQQGLGVGSSPVPIGLHLQNLPTGFQQQQGINSPRGPFASVPGSQTLLQPLIPTNASFNNFVPTRPSSVPSLFSSPAPNPSQQSSFLAPQPGFPQQPPPRLPSFLPPQLTGYPASPPLSQPAEFVGNFGSTPGPFSGNGSFASLQPQPTGFNPGFNQGLYNSSPPPPSNNNQSNNSPASIFAQMKSGTFGNTSTPQSSDKYDALRPQPAGWGFPGVNGYHNGFSGFQ